MIIVLLSKANYKPYEAMEYRLREVNFNHEELMRLNESQKSPYAIIILIN